MVAQVMPPRATARRARDAASRARLPIVVIGVVVLLGLLALLYISQNSVIATLGYDITRLQAERARWTARNEQLRLEIGQLESQTRLEEAATRLGLVPPERITFVQAPRDALPPKTTNDWITQPRDRVVPQVAQQRDALSWLSEALRPLTNGVKDVVGGFR